jgi:hypothetical protein
VGSKQKKLKITLPKLDHFLHRVFVECARAFWKAPFLFAEDLSPIEKQKNVLQAETMCTDALSGAVRSLLPIKSILQDYLEEDDDEPVIAAASSAAAPVDPDSSDSESEDEAPLPAALPAPTTMPPSLVIDETPTEVAPAPAPAANDITIVEKVTTPPAAVPPQTSAHAVINALDKLNVVNLEKSDATVAPEKLMIDTEPSVHFTPYDTVYDETTPEISEIRYAPKISVEDKPPSTWGMFDDDDEDDHPKLAISDASTAIGADDIEDLDAPAAPTALPTAEEEEEDVEVPLTASSDFEELV